MNSTNKQQSLIFKNQSSENCNSLLRTINSRESICALYLLTESYASMASVSGFLRGCARQSLVAIQLRPYGGELQGCVPFAALIGATARCLWDRVGSPAAA